MRKGIYHKVQIILNRVKQKWQSRESVSFLLYVRRIITVLKFAAAEMLTESMQSRRSEDVSRRGVTCYCPTGCSNVLRGERGQFIIIRDERSTN